MMGRHRTGAQELGVSRPCPTVRRTLARHFVAVTAQATRPCPHYLQFTDSVRGRRVPQRSMHRRLQCQMRHRQLPSIYPRKRWAPVSSPITRTLTLTMTAATRIASRVAVIRKAPLCESTHRPYLSLKSSVLQTTRARRRQKVLTTWEEGFPTALRAAQF